MTFFKFGGPPVKKNHIQLQKGLSLNQFLASYGSEVLSNFVYSNPVALTNKKGLGRLQLSPFLLSLNRRMNEPI